MGGRQARVYGLERSNCANPSIQLSSERTRLLQVSDEDLVLCVQRNEVGLLGPEVIASGGQEIPGRYLVGGSIRSTEWFIVDGELDEAGPDGSGGIVLDLDVFGDLNK